MPDTLVSVPKWVVNFVSWLVLLFIAGGMATVLVIVLWLMAISNRQQTVIREIDDARIQAKKELKNLKKTMDQLPTKEEMK